MTKQVMVRAWEIAKSAVKKFGGKVREYFAMSLSIAWKEIKQMSDVITQSWTTARGHEIAISYKTSRTFTERNLFEELVEKVETGLFFTQAIVNGESVSVGDVTRKYKEHKLSLGKVVYLGQKLLLEIEMPEDISLAIFGPFEVPSYIITELKKADNRCKKCGEHCYGDCTSY